MLAPAPPDSADWIVIESTYGNRLHPPTDPRSELAAVLRRVIARKGVVVIPAFAVGRAQVLLHLISQLIEAGEIPPVPLYLNSPMASRVGELYSEFSKLHRLRRHDLETMARLTRTVDTVEASKSLNRHKNTRSG